ncbi:LuxR C-terminal-related transcriptional regulator [Altererythrobacter sp. ZODW24]|uniref:helix-turn-helix transcriptional regulator n=1 Tax=Altererythrobacter sp. ZODW24 TaxID=2185142 RepID=UPI000DF82C7F|nr:LuxR C-terminal-related transcriptional regulator [Altererythrobacter sp. ZODW24]
MNISKNGIAAAQNHVIDFEIGLGQIGGLESLGGKENLSSLFDALTTLDRRKRMLVGRDGTYIVGCKGVTEVLELGSCLRLTNGTVSVAQSKYDYGLKMLLSVRAPDVQTLTLPCERGHGHLLMRATSLNETVVCMSLHHASEVAEPELPDLGEVFHLTKTEALIVHDLFMGHTPQMIADDHDNSVHTIRAHIRRCYDKLGITCREELWSRLNAYRLY